MSIFLLFCSCDALLGVLPFLLGSIECTRGGFYFHFITSKLIQPREGSACEIAKHLISYANSIFLHYKRGCATKTAIGWHLEWTLAGVPLVQRLVQLQFVSGKRKGTYD